jgi:drug/metabolite transporter (DMT)-like permease
VYFIPLFCFVGFSQFIHSQHTFYTILPILKLAVFASSLAFLLFVYSIQRLGMAKTNVFVNLIPVFTAVLSYIFLKEKFTMPKIIGITVVIAGLIVSQYNYSAILSVRTKKQE